MELRHQLKTLEDSMNYRRTAAAVAMVAFLPALVATAGAALAQAPAAVHGCKSGDVCLYDSKDAYTDNKPTVIDNKIPGVYVGGTTDVVAVNNTTSSYSSQGYIELKTIHGASLCEYDPDLSDVQSPGTTENPADGANVTGLGTGTESFVTSVQLLPGSDCGL
jgi:hypothetical protein